jgi:hypothetical protein
MENNREVRLIPLGFIDKKANIIRQHARKNPQTKIIFNARCVKGISIY